jgi:hypothetical protein
VRAHAEVPMPVLTPPEAPPRNIDTYMDEPVPTVEPGPVDAALATPPPRPQTRPPAPRPAPPQTEPARSEPVPPPVPPALTLKPAPGAETKTTEASIRDLMTRASRDLQRVNYAALDADGRAQYDTARRFMQQAEDAMKGGNLAFAGKLADKAATMASVLIR